MLEILKYRYYQVNLAFFLLKKLCSWYTFFVFQYYQIDYYNLTNKKTSWFKFLWCLVILVLFDIY